MTSKETFALEQQKREEVSALYAKYAAGSEFLPDGREVPHFDFPQGVEDEIRRRQDEVSELHDQAMKLYYAEQATSNEAQLKELGQVNHRIVGRPSIGGYSELSSGRGANSYKSLGQRVVESFEYKSRSSNGGEFSIDVPDVDFKTLMTTAGSPGYAPDSPRSNIVVPYAERIPVVADLIPQSTISVPVHKWLEEQAPTNNASQIGEGSAKLESTLDWNEVTQNLTKIAHWVQVTEEQLDDVPGIMSLIDNRLIRLLELQEETQLLNGNGSGNNMQGFLTKSGLQSQAFSTNNADTILKCVTKVNFTGFAQATGVIMNPNNWETVRLIKGATNQDYVLGSPLIDVQPRLWGLPVVLTTAISSGTALVGDFARYSEIRRKTGMTVRVSDQHASNFISNIYVILAEMRELLAIYRGSAFCQATGLS